MSEFFKAPEATAASRIKTSTAFIKMSKISNSVSYKLYDLSVKSAIHMFILLYVSRRRKKNSVIQMNEKSQLTISDLSAESVISDLSSESVIS